MVHTIINCYAKFIRTVHIFKIWLNNSFGSLTTKTNYKFLLDHLVPTPATPIFFGFLVQIKNLESVILNNLSCLRFIVYKSLQMALTECSIFEFFSAIKLLLYYYSTSLACFYQIRSYLLINYRHNNQFLVLDDWYTGFHRVTIYFNSSI